GMNLDGGGSTQMAARPLGEFTVQQANTMESTYARQVVNALAVFSTAPKGELAGIEINSGRTTLFIGEKEMYQVKGYDQYYNPLQVDGAGFQWSSSDPSIGTFANNEFTALKAGTTTLTAQSGIATGKREIEVVGSSQLSSMSFDVPHYVVSAGK